MKRLIFIFTAFLSSFIGVSQENINKEEKESFDAAMEYFYKEDYQTALDSFSFFNEYPNSDLYPRAKFNSATLLRKLNKEDEAAMVFLEILDSNYNEKEAYGGLMEQFTLYKNRSAKNLAEIYLDKKDFEKAAKYIHLFDKKYKYSHFCGNELRADKYTVPNPMQNFL